MGVKIDSNFNMDSKLIGDTEDNRWLNDFLTEKSGIPFADDSIQVIAKAILLSVTLKELVKERYLNGNRFVGWTIDGSKGFTEVVTGDIWIGKTGNGSEPFTLAYECINSTNRSLYRKIGIKYAFKAPSLENREKFAQEILGIEAQAMHLKCKLATEMGKRELVKNHYLEVYDNQAIEKPEKIKKLKKVMIERGVVHVTKPAYEFYRKERYDQIVEYYKERINVGVITKVKRVSRSYSVSERTSRNSLEDNH